MPGMDFIIDCKPKMKIASPPIKLIYLAYFKAILVPKVPISNQKKTAIKLNPAMMKGLTPAATP